MLASTQTLSGIISKAISVVNDGIVPFIFALAIFSFLMGTAKYVTSSGNEEKRKEGAKLMVYGVIGFAIMIAVWSLVKILTETFGFSFGIPQFK